jgi:hypothetical protein
MNYNTIFFVESAVPDLVEHACQESRRKMFRGIIVHLGNVRLHNSRKCETTLTATKARQIHTPTYSPDRSPSDFFFGMLKERMPSTLYSSPKKLISAISEPTTSPPKDQLVSV